MGLMQLGLEGSPDADPSSSEWTFAHGAARSYCCKGHCFQSTSSVSFLQCKLTAASEGTLQQVNVDSFLGLTNWSSSMGLLSILGPGQWPLAIRKCS